MRRNFIAVRLVLKNLVCVIVIVVISVLFNNYIGQCEGGETVRFVYLVSNGRVTPIIKTVYRALMPIAELYIHVALGRA